MKIAIVGASGLIGGYLMAHGRQLGHEMIGTRRTADCGDLFPLDANDHVSMESWLRRETPDAIVYTAAMCWVDGCERMPQDAFRENATNPGFAAKIAGEMGAQFVYISTSYIFDGTKKAYLEEDFPNPLNTYGTSKLKGEELVTKSMNDGALILRTMGVMGYESRGKNFFYQVARAVNENRHLEVPNDQFGNITFAGDFAEACLLLLKRKEVGVWNVAGPDPTVRRSDFAMRIAGPAKVVVPVSTRDLHQEARRPVYGGLGIQKLEAAIPGVMKEWALPMPPGL